LAFNAVPDGLGSLVNARIERTHATPLLLVAVFAGLGHPWGAGLLVWS
jgi:hypothetical protein